VINRLNESDQNDSMHIESTFAQNGTDFFIHMSFASLDSAISLFKRMKDEWHLPVTLYGNRIVIASVKDDYKSVGTYTSICFRELSYGIHFLTVEDAKQFYEFIPSICKTEMRFNNTPYIYLNYNFFKYSLETRLIETKNKENIIFSLLTLSQLITSSPLPKDVIQMIKLIFVMISPKTNIQTPIKFNKHFLCNTQSIPFPKEINEMENQSLEIKTFDSVSYPEIDISYKYESMNSLPKRRAMFSVIDSGNVNVVKNSINKPKEVIIESCYSQDAAMRFYEHHNIKPLVTIFANGFTSGGAGLCKRPPQEESILAISNAPYAMPKDLGDGLVKSFGGLYLISNAEIMIDEKVTPVDFVFVALPNFGQPILSLNTPCEKNYFHRYSYLRHVTSLMIMQFQLAKLNNNVLITGRHGCGIFQNKDEDISAIIHAINRMPQFEMVQVIFALGRNFIPENQNRCTHEIYKNPLQNIVGEVYECIDDIGQCTKLELDKISEDIKKQYIFGMRNDIIEIMQDIDLIEEYLNNGFLTKMHSFTLFSSVEQSEKRKWVREMKIRCLEHLKKYITTNKYDRESFNASVVECWKMLPVSVLNCDLRDIKCQTIFDIINLDRDGEMLESETKTATMIENLFLNHFKPTLSSK